MKIDSFMFFSIESNEDFIPKILFYLLNYSISVKYTKFKKKKYNSVLVTHWKLNLSYIKVKIESCIFAVDIHLQETGYLYTYIQHLFLVIMNVNC